VCGIYINLQQFASGPAKTKNTIFFGKIVLKTGAGEGNRTLVASLEVSFLFAVLFLFVALIVYF